MKDVEETVQLWISGAFSRFRPPGCVECVMFGFSRNTPGESIGNMMETMEDVTVDFVLGACSRSKATNSAFAAICGGAVNAWGNPEEGGDSSGVQDQLQSVEQIQATGRAFAALLADGSVVTWGDAASGGDNSMVRHQLQNVQQIQATDWAFAAILADGSVVS